MSHSSSGSWSAHAPPAGDIIDLDRFMRTARPTRAPRDIQLTRNGQLVVDGGSLSRKPASTVSSVSSARASGLRARDKRQSHDSGLSDGSFARRPHRSHRRVSGAESAARAASSAASLRAFRAACERALREQQAAIARVAQLCQRLGERRDSSPDTSEPSSTSTERRKGKRRPDECKTYKIIMTKLDELGRLFAARGRSLPPARPDAAPDSVKRDFHPDVHPDVHPDARPDAYARDVCPPVTRSRDMRRLHDSSRSSVSVSDKLVATDPSPGAETVLPITQLKRVREGSAPRLVERAAGAGAAPSRRSARVAAMCGTSAEPVLRDDSTAGGPSSVGSSSACVPLCGFDLDNPVHLYAQAKRLQALHATTHVGGRRAGAPAAGAAGAGARRAWAGCVRALRHCVAPLCCPQGWV